MSQFFDKQTIIKIINEKIEDANKVLNDDDLVTYQVGVQFVVNSRSAKKKDIVDGLSQMRTALDSAPDNFLFQPALMIQSVDVAGEKMVAEEQARIDARAKLTAPPSKKKA